MLVHVEIKARTDQVVLHSDDGQTKIIPLADWERDAASHKADAFAAAPPALPTAEEKLEAFEAELAAMADPYANAWEGAKVGIARWAAIERLLVSKLILTEKEITDMAATLEVDGAGVVASIGG